MFLIKTAFKIKEKKVLYSVTKDWEKTQKAWVAMPFLL